MRFYTQQHQFYCGIDLHARTMYVCILDQAGNKMVHRNISTDAERFLKLIEPYQANIVVAVESMFSWYWIADLCSEKGLPFVLGHALYMKAIHGGKAKNDKIDSLKIATLLKGGLIPMAYVYPAKMRSTRDLLRRRMHLMRKRAELLAHIQNTNTQYNLPQFSVKLRYKSNRPGTAERFSDPSAARAVEVDLSLIDFYDELLKKLELDILRMARQHDLQTLSRLRTVPGIGEILSLVMLYEIHDIRRFPRVQNFISYCRLVKCVQTSAGKPHGSSGHKIGNAHLKWAFSEASVLFLRYRPEAKKFFNRLVRKHGKGKALSVLACKLARAVYYILAKEKAFDMKIFLNQ